jgi:hypothetical protein
MVPRPGFTPVQVLLIANLPFNMGSPVILWTLFKRGDPLGCLYRSSEKQHRNLTHHGHEWTEVTEGEYCSQRLESPNP